MNEYITEIERKLKYKFNDKNLLIQAYTRRSFSEENPGKSNNEILEFIGDAVINFYVTKELVERYKESTVNEGYLSKQREKIVCGESLSKKALRLQLIKPEYFRLGKGDIKGKVWEQASVQEDLLESIFGVIALDCNYNPAQLYASTVLLLEFVHIDSIADIESINTQILYEEVIKENKKMTEELLLTNKFDAQQEDTGNG